MATFEKTTGEVYVAAVRVLRGNRCIAVFQANTDAQIFKRVARLQLRHRAPLFACACWTKRLYNIAGEVHA